MQNLLNKDNTYFLILDFLCPSINQVSVVWEEKKDTPQIKMIT